MSFELPAFRTWYVVITIGCNYKCSYCTFDQTMFRLQDRPKRVSYPHLGQEQWIEGLNAIDNRPDFLIFTGGEPLLYPGFAGLLAGLEDYRVKINSNLSLHVDRFVDEAGRDSQLLELAYLSFHPEYHHIEPYLLKAASFRDSGVAKAVKINVMGRDDSPESVAEQQEITERLLAEGFDLDVGPTEMADDYLQSAFRIRRRVECDPDHLVIAPNGDVHECFTKLYDKVPPRGNIITRQKLRDFETLHREWIPCDRFGECNMCQDKRQRMPEPEFRELVALRDTIRAQDNPKMDLAPRGELTFY